MRASLVLVTALLLAGCGTGEEEGGEGGAAPSPPPVEPASSLEVTVWPAGRDNGPEHVTSLECDPPGGTHPAPEEACTILAANPDLLEPLPEDVICTQQYGGPEQARIRGTFAGREVDLDYSRANGCQIARWDTLERVFSIDV